MPLPKKNSLSIAKSKTLPKNTSKQPSLSRTKTPKIQPKKTGGSPPILSRVSSNILNMPDDILGNFDIITLMKLFSTKKDLKILLETVDLTNVKINKSIINFLDNHLYKTEVKKLILYDIKFEDQHSFNAFIKTLKSFENIEELEIIRFWSEQYKYKKTNGYYNDFFINLIKNIRILQNIEKLTIESIDIEEETDKNTGKLFSNVFLETLEKLVKLKHLIFQRNSISPDTSADINGGVKINGRIIKLPTNIIIEKSGNFTKMEIGH